MSGPCFISIFGSPWMKVFVLVCVPNWKGPLKSVLGVPLCLVGSLEGGVWRKVPEQRKKCSEGHGGLDQSVCRWFTAWHLSASEQVGHITSANINQVNKCFNTDTEHVGRLWLTSAWLVSQSEPSINWSLFTVSQRLQHPSWQLSWLTITKNLFFSHKHTARSKFDYYNTAGNT